MSLGERDASRRRFRRRRLAVCAVLAVGCCAAVAWVPLLGIADVDRIEVFGLHETSTADVLAAADIRLGDALIGVDADGAEARLRSLAWVHDALVTRHVDGSIRIDVAERRPAAVALAAPASWVLVDRSGRVLTEPLRSVPDLPRLSGLRAAGPPGAFLDSDSEALLELLDIAQSSIVVEPRAVWRDGRGDIWAELTNGATAVIGDDTALHAKIAALAAVTDRQLSGDRALDPSGSETDLTRGRVRTPDGAAIGLGLGPLAGTVIDVSVAHLPVVRRGAAAAPLASDAASDVGDDAAQR